MRALWSAHTRESARSYTIAEADIRDGYAFVEALPCAELKTNTIPLIEVDYPVDIRPYKRASSEETRSYDRVTTIAMLINETFNDRGGIVLDVDAIGSRRAEIIMMKQSVVTKTHLICNATY